MTGPLIAALAGLLATVAGDAAAQAARPLNAVLILGYGARGCHGNPQIRTPHVDALAASGTRCADGYVTAPGSVHEGGIGGPFAVRWPGRLPAGAGVPKGRTRDGVNLVPYLPGAATGRPHETAGRAGDRKRDHHGQGARELDDLGHDVGAARNLADTEPARRQSLLGARETLNAAMVEPAFR